MSSDTERYDCIVVGAGPVGMTAAALLSEGGASVLVLERNLTTSSDPKAISINDEALRTYAQAGLMDGLMSIIVPGTGTKYFDAAGRPLFHARAEKPYRFGFPFKNPFAQPDLERLLLGALSRRENVTVRFGAVVDQVVSTPSGVTVRVASQNKNDNSERHISARFLLGADGGRSTVRTHLGVSMSGRAHREEWLVVDALNDSHRERYGMHFGDPHRPHVIVPGLEGRCRYEFRLFEGEHWPGGSPSLELIQRVLASHRTIEEADVERAVVYRFNGLIADQWRVHSAFLLGDAAHMMPPFAGQGLNTGIRDAANLSWKLLAVLRGNAPVSILDTYQTERYKHALATIRTSELLGRIVMTTSERVAAIRDQKVRAALETAAGRDYFEFMRYNPANKLSDGLVILLDDQLSGRQIGQPRAFDTASSVVAPLDSICGYGWRLFRVSDSETDWPEAVVDFAEVRGVERFDIPLTETYPHVRNGRILIDVDTRLIEEFAPYRGRIVLVRPDHFVAAAWNPADSPAILGQIQSWWA